MKGGLDNCSGQVVDYEEVGDICCDVLPDDLVVEILQRLPVKSLLRFQTVSKTWKSLILSPRFIRKHLIHQKKATTGIKYIHGIEYLHLNHHNQMGISLITKGDNDQNCPFSSRVLSLDYPLPIWDVKIVGSSNGLVCIKISREKDFKKSYVIWNPAIRKLKLLPDPPAGDSMLKVVGFSYIPSTDCYKLVRILAVKEGSNNGINNVRRYRFVNRFVNRVQVLEIGKDSWREVLYHGHYESTDELPVYIFQPPIVFKGCLYSFGSTLGDKEGSCRSMTWFDMEKEVFERKIWTSLSYPFDDNFKFSNTIYKLGIFEENLAMFISPRTHSEYDVNCYYDVNEDERENCEGYCQVWIYEEANKVWKNRFTFGPLPAGCQPVGFLGDQVILQADKIMEIEQRLIAVIGLNVNLYNLISTEKTNYPCSELFCKFTFYPYVESLVQV